MGEVGGVALLSVQTSLKSTGGKSPEMLRGLPYKVEMLLSIVPALPVRDRGQEVNDMLARGVRVPDVKREMRKGRFAKRIMSTI